MSDAPVTRDAADDAADARAIDVAEAADASAEALLNAGDVGDDEVVAKAAAEDVWTRGKRALLAFAHREPAEAPKEQPDDDDDNTGFLERIRGAGKRLVG